MKLPPASVFALLASIIFPERYPAAPAQPLPCAPVLPADLDPLDYLNAPSVGVRIAWGRCAPSVPNEHGGRTVMYQFILEGVEALRTEWFDVFARTVQGAGGHLLTGSVYDMENDNALVWQWP